MWALLFASSFSASNGIARAPMLPLRTSGPCHMCCMPSHHAGPRRACAAPPVALLSSSTAPGTAGDGGGGGEGLGVVITGGTKGVGFALAQQFLHAGDRVLIVSRDASRMDAALRALDAPGRVFGVAADVSRAADVARIGAETAAGDGLAGRVDVWINNAAQVGGRRGMLVELETDDICGVVATNLLGALLGCREAERVMRERGGHCFCVDGAGSTGNATAGYAAYGATKRAIPQMVASISKELSDSKVRFHLLSPGMVLTDLLLAGNADVKTRRFFNYLAEEPDTVAKALVPRIRAVAQKDKRSQYIRFLTVPKAFVQLLGGFLFGFRRNRYFDEVTGKRVDKEGLYNENGVRREWSR